MSVNRVSARIGRITFAYFLRRCKFLRVFHVFMDVKELFHLSAKLSVVSAIFSHGSNHKKRATAASIFLLQTLPLEMAQSVASQVAESQLKSSQVIGPKKIKF